MRYTLSTPLLVPVPSTSADSPGVTKPTPADPVISDGLFLTVDLSVSTRQGGWISSQEEQRASSICPSVAEYDPQDFWEQVRADQHKRLILEPEEFYLLMSDGGSVHSQGPGRRDDRIRPDQRRAEDPLRRVLRSGVRVLQRKWQARQQGSAGGTRPRRSHSPSSTGRRLPGWYSSVWRGHPTDPTGSEIGSSYQNQRLKLSKMFRDWPVEDRAAEGFLSDDPLRPWQPVQRAPHSV